MHTRLQHGDASPEKEAEEARKAFERSISAVVAPVALPGDNDDDDDEGEDAAAAASLRLERQTLMRQHSTVGASPARAAAESA